MLINSAYNHQMLLRLLEIAYVYSVLFFKKKKIITAYLSFFFFYLVRKNCQMYFLVMLQKF